ncbi:Ribosomal RNA small subunit methyltransferase H [Waddlia chondrophila 2032/99]|uniref:Ribosomal RNA small subunit methyltransferase H n=1 Tax=Waddlia chondrophila 2032/99 TaxID=765953 RepID=F8LBR8_9BACT|nr:Ribosomal RNA small subunit methyltransferase H [Waddlia chondrophila 2032/99]
MIPHLSVLLEEVAESFSDVDLKRFVDGTLGAGGHSAEILSAHPEIQRFLGIDQDPDALEIARERLSKWSEKVVFQRGNFSDLKEHLVQNGLEKVDGILLDLGVSSMQFDRPERGFSLQQDGPLDMRMNPEEPLTAAEIVNTWSEAELGDLFKKYGEEKRWRAAARAVAAARPISRTLELVEVLTSVLGRPRKGKIHPATLIFQALRLAVNREIERIEEVIPQAIGCLNPGGRLAVISFHSLEDRIVKRQFRYLADDKESTRGVGGVFISKEPVVNLITRKPIVPGKAEVERNPRSRSSKLRVVEKR